MAKRSRASRQRRVPRGSGSGALIIVSLATLALVGGGLALGLRGSASRSKKINGATRSERIDQLNREMTREWGKGYASQFGEAPSKKSLNDYKDRNKKRAEAVYDLTVQIAKIGDELKASSSARRFTYKALRDRVMVLETSDEGATRLVLEKRVRDERARDKVDAMIDEK